MNGLKMVNKRLLELAGRQKNEKVPDLIKVEKKLEGILERDENGKPILELKPIEKKAVHASTKEKYKFSNCVAKSILIGFILLFLIANFILLSIFKLIKFSILS